MFIVLDKIVGEGRKQCLINTDHIASISPVDTILKKSRYGKTCITLATFEDGYNDDIYTDLKVGHIPEMMNGFVDMIMARDVSDDDDRERAAEVCFCECGHNSDYHDSDGECSACKCEMFDDKVG